MGHWDVSTAFVHAPLAERVYMRQASGHEVKGKETWVYQLVKALYGTKQAARAWQQHLKILLQRAKCLPLENDAATYVRREGTAFVLIGTHVDDLFVLHNALGTRLKDEVWKLLSTELAIKDLGEATWTLQMNIARNAKQGWLKLSQEGFTKEVLRRFNMLDCKTAPTPAVDVGDEVTITEADMPTDAAEQKRVAELPVMELVGCLWWLAQMTRPDIYVALQKASKWVARPSDKLWRWLQRILRYLAGTQALGLTFKRHASAPPLEAYVDAAFANETDYKSTAGWVFLMHGALTAYESSTIKRVVTSSTEAECNALATVGKENTWERRIYAELKGVDVGPTPIWGDNTASIAMIGAGMTKRSRHYAIEWHKVSDLVEAKEMSVQWVATQDNLADSLRKSSPGNASLNCGTSSWAAAMHATSCSATCCAWRMTPSTYRRHSQG